MNHLYYSGESIKKGDNLYQLYFLLTYDIEEIIEMGITKNDILNYIGSEKETMRNAELKDALIDLADSIGRKTK